MDKKASAPKKAIWLLILFLGISLAAAGLFYAVLKMQSRRDIERIRTIYADRTENFVNAVFHKTDVLAAVVKLENGDITQETFDSVAKIVYEKDSGIRGIQYMPGAVVTYSYPVEGNEAVIGKNFLEIPERRDDCLLAIRTKSIALSGPYHLIQGGLGLVARNPVFLTDASGKEVFWGFSAIVLDLPDAVETVGLGTLPDSGYDFQLFSINENGERIVIEGDSSLDTAKAVCGTISVSNHEWTLALAERYPWMNFLKALLLFLGAGILSFVLWRLYCTVLREREAVRAKDRFFSDISHDMRTPLNAIIGFSSLAEMPGTSSAEKDDYLRKIRSSGSLMLDLVNDTLTISKANSGKLALQESPVYTETLGTSIIAPIREIAAQKGILFTLDKSGYRPRTVLADQLKIQKIFLNLLNNAVKFTPEGGHVQVTVKDEPQGAADPDLVTVIQDDGIGMSPAFMKKMYEPFTQEQKKGYEGTGTGLGLSIVRQLVTMQGGTIDVKSSEGKGTQFTVRLHLKETEAKETETEATEAGGTGTVINPADPESLSGKRILLCEDNAMNRQIAEALLKSKGMLVETAENGRVGVEKFASSVPGAYCAVLMDIRMPVMDGLEAAKEIRKLEREDAASVPIIAMTADVFEEDIRRCKEAGMNGHLPKPIDPQKLYETLGELL